MAIVARRQRSSLGDDSGSPTFQDWMNAGLDLTSVAGLADAAQLYQVEAIKEGTTYGPDPNAAGVGWLVGAGLVLLVILLLVKK